MNHHSAFGGCGTLEGEISDQRNGAAELNTNRFKRVAPLLVSLIAIGGIISLSVPWPRRGARVTRAARTATESIAAAPPTVTLRNAANDGVEMPWIGLGTAGYSTNASVGYGGYPECFAEDAGCGAYAERALLDWIGSGGRRLDCANNYRSERAVGDAIRKSGVPRGELFVLSKVGLSYSLGYQDALDQFEDILRDLRTDYVDLLLIHWPEQGLNTDPAHGGTATKDPACRMDDNYDATRCRLSTWRAMVHIWKSGGARAVGVSNYYRPHLEEIVAAGLPLPALTQNPFHLYRSSTQQMTIDLCRRLGIVFNGYSPLGVPDWHSFPAGTQGGSSQGAMSPKQMDDPEVVSVAQALGSTPAQALLAWQWQLGIPVNPRSQNRRHMVENLGAWKFRLDANQMEVLSHRPQDWCSVDPQFYECAPDESSDMT